MCKFKKELLSFFILLSFAVTPAISAPKKTSSPPQKSASKKVASAEKNKKNNKKKPNAVAQKNVKSKTVKSKKTSQKTAALSGNNLAANTTNSRVRVAHHKRAGKSQPLAPMSYSLGNQAGLHKTYDPLSLNSSAAIVIDPTNFTVLFEKNSHVALPMASITKLMTALVVVESMQNMSEILEITEHDIDRTKGTSSRLRVGTRMSRADMLHLALMSSENRAAAALGRNYPGGIKVFVADMNIKAQVLGMEDTRFVDSSGLSGKNVASALDLSKLVMAASQYPILRRYSTDTDFAIDNGIKLVQYGNTNRLVHNPSWEINLQKTGYISEAGQCLVMHSVIDGRPIVMVFLDAKGKQSRIEDAMRVREWIISNNHNTPHV